MIRLKSKTFDFEMLKSTPAQLKARKNYYDKNNEVIKKQHAEYYKLYCDAIKTKKKALHKAKRERELLERGVIPKPRKPRTKKKKPIIAEVINSPNEVNDYKIP